MSDTITTDLALLSDNARRWALFFNLPTRRRARLAIAVGLVRAGKCPGFTKPIFVELNTWASSYSSRHEHSISNVVAIDSTRFR